MKSQMPKVLHKIAGRTLVERVLAAADAVSPATVTRTIVIGLDRAA